MEAAGQQVVVSSKTPTQLGMEHSPVLLIEGLPYVSLLLVVHIHLWYGVAGEHLVGMPWELVQERVCQ